MEFLDKIHSVAIYPSIGMARVGNSPDEYFFGSMIPGEVASDKDDFRDKKGRIKRQAAKFFVYALDKEGNVLGEINEDNGGKVDWRVDVANKKASWYQFDIALDIPTAEGKFDMDGNALDPPGLPVLSQFRNRSYEGHERKKLMIEARAKSIEGRNVNQEGGKYELKGTIGKEEKEVYLGEVRTDEAGRLIFLGGRGLSGSFDGDHPLTTFANNEGWHDDTSDGPIDVKVTLPNGKVLTTEGGTGGAWVVTAPPNYAVGVQAFSTGYELLLDLFTKTGRDKKPSFYADIYPTLQQLSINQWVNAGVLKEFGWGSSLNFEDPKLIARLTDDSIDNRFFRQSLFNNFRDPNAENMQPANWPPLYGDAVTFNINSTDPRNWFAITALKYEYLRKWAEGDFHLDDKPVKKSWTDLSPSEQANGLTEAALEETLGGPFHPGCEFTWPMRHDIMYHAPFRIKRRKNAKEDFGVAISHDIVLAEGGPLDGSSPGDITKWMATPWQSDTSSCLSAYRTYAGEYLPTFWPARVPNDVLTEEDFHTINSSQNENDKVEAFNPHSRKKWLRGYIYDEDGNIKGGSSISERMKGVEKFTKEWYKIGIILEKEVENDVPFLPKNVWVETGRFKDLDPPKTRGISSAPKKAYERPTWIDENPRKYR